MTKFSSISGKAISAMNGPELLALFNEAATLVGAPICKRFASLTSGFTRTMKMVEQAKAHESAHGSIAAEPAVEPVSVTKEKVAAKIKKAPAEVFEKPKAKKAATGAKVWEIPEDGSCPKCGGPDGDITPAGLEDTAAEQRQFCHGCSFEWHPETGKEYKAPKETEGLRSAAIAKSWADPAVAAARSERTGVAVKGKGEFPSVRKAFVALGLPLAKHIKFRGDLKKAGTLEINGLVFTTVAKG